MQAPSDQTGDAAPPTCRGLLIFLPTDVRFASVRVHAPKLRLGQYEIAAAAGC